MDVEVHPVKGVQVVDLVGELNSQTASNTYDTVVEQVCNADRVVIDMHGVTYMSSVGIRALLRLYRSLINGGSNVCLVSLSDDLQNVLSITGFLEFFNTYDTLDMGIQAA